MRRYYKRQYQPPARKQPLKKPYQPLQQPEWDATIHDLSQLKLSPEEQLRRRLSRISKNQLGVALLDRSNCSYGSASARYTPSIGSAEDHAGTDSDNDSSNENQLQRQSHDIARKQQQQQQVDLEHASGSDDDDDICQWQGAANSPPQHQQRAVLGDIGNSSRGNGPMHDSQQKHKLQQPGARVPAEVAVLTSQVTEGHIAVPTATLQALFDKIDSLEQQLQQQQLQQEHSSPPRQDCQLQQQAGSSRQELLETQEQLAQLQEEHRQYVSHTSSLLMRLQGQLQQLMSQSPGLTGTGILGSFASQQHGTVTASSAPAAVSVPLTRQQENSNSILEALGPAPFSSRDRSSAGGARSPSKQHLRAATAVATTASPCKSVGGLGTELPPGPAVSGTTGPGRVVGATAAAGDAVALPSYAEMRQRASFSRSSAMGLGSRTARTTAIAATFDRSWTEAGASSMAGHASSSSSAAAAPHQDTFDMYGSDHAGNLLFSRLVPQPAAASNAAASAAAKLSGGAAQQQQQAQIPGSWTNIAQVAAVTAEYDHDASAALLSPALAADISLPGLRDTDWGLQQGLPMAAVGRVFTDAGRFEGVEMP